MLDTSFAALARRAAAATALLAGAALPFALPLVPLGAQAPLAPTVASAVTSPRDTLDDPHLDTVRRPTVPFVSRFRSNADSIAYERTRDLADRATGLRVLVLLEDRQLAVMQGADTLMVAPIAIGMDTTISYGSRSWRFETPRGRRAVLSKEENPVWVPPEWHYAEVASKRGLRLQALRLGRAVRLADGRQLTIRGGRVGLLAAGEFTALPTDEEIVFDNTLFIPPHGTENRRIPGELGRFKMVLGDGYLLHGTPYEDTIGQNATHGCVRLYDEDIEWLFNHVPVGTPVFIF